MPVIGKEVEDYHPTLDAEVGGVSLSNTRAPSLPFPGWQRAIKVLLEPRLALVQSDPPRDIYRLRMILFVQRLLQNSVVMDAEDSDGFQPRMV